MKFCEQPWTTFTITADGSMVPCLCGLWNTVGSIGNMINQDVREILQSKKLKDFVIQNARFGTNFLNKMSEFDAGQSVVVSNTIVYAIEALEGTDEMIIRAGELYNNYFQNSVFGPVLIKIPKLNQNFNMDLPVIGLETIKKCNELGFSAIVLSSNGTLIAEIDIVKNYLKKNKFCIFAI